MNANSPATILALLAEIARWLNQNLTPLKLAPMDPVLCTSVNAPAAATSTPTTNV